MAMVATFSLTRPDHAAADGCGTLPVSVSCGAGADPPGGYVHGLIGVTGQDWVLDLARFVTRRSVRS